MLCMTRASQQERWSVLELTDEEVAQLSRCKNFTLNRGSGRGKNVKYNPYVFTEQGIYMLMTVLRGNPVTKQSRALIRTFKQMKDYIIENQGLLNQRDFLQLSLVVAEHGRDIDVIKSSLGTIDKEVADVVDYLGHVVTKSELSGFMNIFGPPEFRSYYRENSIAIKGKAVYHMFSKARSAHRRKSV